MMEQLWRVWSRASREKTERIRDLEARLEVALTALSEIASTNPRDDAWGDIQYVRDAAESALFRIGGLHRGD